MLVTDYLKSHMLADLERDYAVTARRGATHPNLVLLKYSQIESPMGEPIVRECRGVVLDEADGWAVVSRSYDKFFNHGEGHAPEIDWATARAYEKLDGSLVTLYPYRGEWHVATTGTPDASGSVNGGSKTFAQLFWETWTVLGYKLPPPVGNCFMFELMTPLNRVVVRHERPRIVLHGVRNLDTMLERRPEADARANGWECVASYPLGTLEQIVAAAAKLEPTAGEGYVVCDDAFRRVKVKSPQYVALAHLKDGMSARRLLEIARLNEGGEFLAHFPEWSEPYAKVRGALDALCGECDTAFAALKHLPTQKEFALEAAKCRWSSALFALRAGKCNTAREFAATATRQAVERAVGLEAMAAELDRMIGTADPQ